MLAKVRSCAVVGMEGVIVEVEVDISGGLPFFAVVGLPDAAVQEAPSVSAPLCGIPALGSRVPGSWPLWRQPI